MIDTASTFAKGKMRYWLASKPSAVAFVETIGLAFDTVLEATYESVLLKTAKFAPFDALPMVAEERKMFRSPTETDEQFRTELARHIFWHSINGQARCLPLQFARCGLSVSIFRNSQMLSMPDYDAANWPRMWIVIQQPNPFISAAKWTTGEKYNAGRKWTIEDSSTHKGTIAFIKKVLSECLSPHVDLRGVYVSLDENGLGPLGTNWDGTPNFMGRKIAKIV